MNSVNTTNSLELNSYEYESLPNTPIDPSFTMSYYPLMNEYPVLSPIDPYYTTAVTSCCPSLSINYINYDLVAYHNTNELNFYCDNNNNPLYEYILPSPTNQQHHLNNSSPSSLELDNILADPAILQTLEQIKPQAGRPSRSHANKNKRRVNSLPGLDKLNKGKVSANNENEETIKPFECPKEDCNKVFKRSEHLKRHVNTVHSGIKPYVCPYPDCEKRFSRSDNLGQHYKTHIPKSRKKSATF